MTEAFLNWLINLGPKPEGWMEFEAISAFVAELEREAKRHARSDKRWEYYLPGALKTLKTKFGFDREGEQNAMPKV